jgi:Holliday junction resolvase RusA-like endonuclease
LEYQRQVGKKVTDDFPLGSKVPLSMMIRAYYGVPKSVSAKKREAMISGKSRPTKKPDMDNIIKVVADALNGIAYYDDSQIVDCRVAKVWSDEPRVEVVIEVADDGYGQIHT